MEMIENILSQELVQRLGWTLVHFLWQGAAVAVILAVALRLLRKASANVRYLSACAALGLIVLLPVITLWTVDVSGPVIDMAKAESANLVASGTTVMPIVEAGPIEIVEPAKNVELVLPRVSLLERFVELIEPSLPYVVVGWFVGVFGLSVWHLGGWRQLQKLRRKSLKPVTVSLQNRLKELARRLGINRIVSIAESGLVHTPMVIGWLKPVILLPGSALTGLTTEQLEAILAHELAHIKRCDYLVNILQTVVEILGFYHPGLWWVSAKIRDERENCCDDWAVSISDDRLTYAEALTSMAEIRPANLAVAATGGSLFNRITRLLGKDSTEQERAARIPYVIVVLLVMAIVIPTGFALTNQSDEKLTGLERVVVEGIRTNRDKFERGILAWNWKRIDTRYEGPRGNLSGQHQLWWNGKKVTTKYLRDEVHSDPKGRYSVIKQQGGNSYDGGLFSRKPKSRDDNWLGPIAQWRGQGSQDWMIRQDSKHNKNISKDWSVIEANGIKLVRFKGRNTNKTDSDYGGYIIRDYDPSKGYGLVNEEWYNPNGNPRMKHTVRLQEVIPGGWFPVEVDTKHFAVTDGRLFHNNHYALDIKRCSFNDKSALPKGIFELDIEKQLNHQEKLQKYLAMELAGLSNVKEVAKADKVKRGARDAIEKFIAAAMAGDLEKAGGFAHPDKLPANQIADIAEIAKGKDLWIMAVLADDSSAIAVSSVIRGDRGRMGPLVFFLDRAAMDGPDNWLVHDIDMETPDGAEVELKQFLEDHPEAEKVPKLPGDV